jgi:3-hydroxyisobutyrate dehydrogenase-like beta-hydroxyacid dehydrogenase
MMLKDVDLILDAGRECDVPLLMTSMTCQILQSLTTESFADEDFFVTVKALERQAGLSTDL